MHRTPSNYISNSCIQDYQRHLRIFDPSQLEMLIPAMDYLGYLIQTLGTPFGAWS